MNKKITSLVIALAMLMQTTVSASLLSTHVAGYPTTYRDGSLFSYTIFNNTLGRTPEKVMPAVLSTVSTTGANSFAEHTAGSPLYGHIFDFMVELDMTPVKNAFSYLYEMGRNVVLASAPSNQAALQTNFDNSKVAGQFTVNVTYSNGLSPAAAPSISNLDFKQKDSSGNLITSPTFEVTGVTVGSGTMQVTFKVIDDPANPLTFLDIKNDANYLNNLVVTIPNVTATVPNTVLTVTTTMEGKSTFADPENPSNLSTTTYTDYGFIEYDSEDTHNVSAVYYSVSAPSGGGGGSLSSGPNAFTVVDGVETPVTVKKDGLKYIVDLDAVENPVKEGYAFDGWYLDEAMTQPASGIVEITRNTYFYGKFVTEKDEAYSVVGGRRQRLGLTERDGKNFLNVNDIEIPTMEGFVFEGWYDTPYYQNRLDGEIDVEGLKYVYARFVNITPPGQLISDEHILYIVGYPDGEVKPMGYITREEVVAALYRLLKPEYREQIESTEQFFPDVEPERWSYNDISTMYNGDYVAGYDDGLFYPGKPITRAEFVTLIRNFAPVEVEPYAEYSDISGHWAEDYIKKATALSWITGYEDGTFRPDNKITRAEAMTIINSILVRYGDVDSELAHQWPDLDKSDWYYGPVIEATTAHTFERAEDGWNENWHKEGSENSALTNDPFYLDLIDGKNAE